METLSHHPNVVMLRGISYSPSKNPLLVSIIISNTSVYENVGIRILRNGFTRGLSEEKLRNRKRNQKWVKGYR